MTETVELKNCPFCGGTDQVDATMEGKVQFETFVSAASVMAVKVVCACGASGRGFIERPDGYIQAAKFWNTRSDPAVRDRVTDEMVERACAAAASTYATYPCREVSAHLSDWFDLDAQDAVDFKVLQTPEWNYYSDIRGEQFEAYIAAVLREPMRAAITAALRTSPPEPASGLEAAVRSFMPLAQVAFLWTKEAPPEQEVNRYRDAYQAVLRVLPIPPAKEPQ